MDFSSTRATTVIARLRAGAGLTQSAVAQHAGLDQSRISRVEKGEVINPAEVDRVLDALAQLGVSAASAYKEFAGKEWLHIEPPSFWNPQRACLELTEETLGKIEGFLTSDEHPWPLRRQIEKHKDSIVRAATFLNRLNHNIAFVGDQGVGKSTAISFIFDLLMSTSSTSRSIDRTVLERGGGGTTICEVHIKSGPEFGLAILPMTDAEVSNLVADYCAVKWTLASAEQRASGEAIGVSREVERAIRNMSGLVTKKETVDGKIVYHDAVLELARSSSSEEEFRTRLLGLMKLSDRTRRELWYNSATRKTPMEWVTETFRAVNNGRLVEVPLPRAIDLLIPGFGQAFGELEISVVDTKGIDDVAVREDLDLRLRDPRTAVVFCSRFNDAPGTSTRILLRHMRQTFSERVDTGKVAILALPRSDEARSMKDDMGEYAVTDAEGYELKRLQVAGELAADDLKNVPMMFFNVESDEPAAVRDELFAQLNRLRSGAEDHLFDLCAAAQEIIENHAAQALTATIQEVANRLNTFLSGNRRLSARERLAHTEAIETVHGVRYASTLWAATRRNGEYSGLNFLHLVGVGAARDAGARCDQWFASLEAFLNSLNADSGLSLGRRTIDQIAASAAASRKSFLDAVQRAGVEVYRESLTQAPVWADCAAEWGKGPGFKVRVASRLERWFSQRADLKDGLEKVINSLWERTVIMPLARLAEESAPEPDVAANVVMFPTRGNAA